MKIALLGKGKTGGKVQELMDQQMMDYTIFDSTHLATSQNLLGHDVIISFLSGEIFLNHLPLLLESRIPVICGSTGMKWPINFDQSLKDLNLKWIYATNFSLGMNLVHQMILIMKEAAKIFDEYQFSLHEVHHTKKLDAPSGTALSWKDWSGHSMEITSERKGDVTGIHELTLSTPYEEIIIKHKALDRKIFASGALYAADKILNDKSILVGLHLFQDIVQNELTKKQGNNP